MEQWLVLTEALSKLMGKQEFCRQSAVNLAKVLDGNGPFYTRTNDIFVILLRYANYQFAGMNCDGQFYDTKHINMILLFYFFHFSSLNKMMISH